MNEQLTLLTQPGVQIISFAFPTYTANYNLCSYCYKSKNILILSQKLLKDV